MAQHFLSLGAVFKNEIGILKEWLEHYLAEGVEKFYLIDNGSTDEPESILAPYIDSGQVVLFKDPQRHAQTILYDRYFLPIKGESEWMMVVDLDEFVYARGQFQTIPDFLRHCKSPHFAGVLIPWKMFGSSGHINHPADNKVIPHFLMRKHYNGTKGQGMQNANDMLVKAIVKTSYLQKFHVHSHKLHPPVNFLPDFQRTNNIDFQPISEGRLVHYHLHLNHYSIQSKEFWQKVKMTRGAADSREHENIRTMKIFDAFDENEIRDDELARKRATEGIISGN